jgi:hypothetical protein
MTRFKMSKELIAFRCPEQVLKALEAEIERTGKNK